MKKFWDTLQTPWIATAINFTLACGAYVGNHFHQAFCQPVAWAAIVLVVTFLPVVFWPLLGGRWIFLHPLLQVLRGMAFCICLYCICFLDWANLILPIMIPVGYGIAGFAPYFFGGQMIYGWFRSSNPWMERSAFLTGIVFSLVIAGYFVWDFQQAIPIARQLAAKPEVYDGPHQHSVEWILGMHFKYHTRQDVVSDGWRPPLHDPFGVIGFWSTGRQDPLSMDLESRLALYKSVFPSLPYKVDCTCASDRDGLSYLRDPLLK
jgi:hypothetical protein